MGRRWDDWRRLLFQSRKGSHNTGTLIGFLDDLNRRLRGQKATLVRVLENIQLRW